MSFTNKSTQPDLFQILSTLYPSRGGVFVGPAPRFEDSVIAHTQATDWLVIDSDKKRAADWASRGDHPGKNVLSAVLTEKPVERTYYLASLPQESGLIDPDLLKELWQNISTSSSHNTTTRTLADILGRICLQPNWLEIRLLNGLETVSGLRDQLEIFDVVILRTISSPSNSAQLSEYSKQNLEAYMHENEFVLLTSIGDRHPSIELVVFVRDYRQQSDRKTREHLEQLTKAQSELENNSQEARTTVQRLTKQLNETDAELSARIVELSSSKSELEESQKSNSTLAMRVKKLSELEAKADLAEQNRILAENNLRSLESKYRALAKKNQELSEKLLAVRMHLGHVISMGPEQLDEISDPHPLTSSQKKAAPAKRIDPKKDD